MNGGARRPLIKLLGILKVKKGLEETKTKEIRQMPKERFLDED